MKNTPIGIDTLHLTPQEWRLEWHFRAKVQPAPYDSRDGDMTDGYRLFTVEGKRNYGTEAKVRLRSCVLEFNPRYNKATKDMEISTKITMTVPKIVGPNNYHPANVKQLKKALRIVATELSEHGFQFNIQMALVKRLDMARTFEAREPWPCYRPVLAMLKPTGITNTVFASGHRWGKKPRQLELYEKGLEMASRYKKKQRAAIYGQHPANSIRAERRWLQTHAFEADTGIRTVSGLLSNFSHVQAVYREAFRKSLFRFAPTEFDKLRGSGLSVGEVVEEMRQAKEKNRYWFQEWVNRDWARNLSLERMDTIDAAVRQFMAEEKIASQNVAGKLRKMRHNYAQSAPSAGSSRSIADIYGELRDKIFGGLRRVGGVL